MANLAPNSATLAELADVHGQAHVLAVGVSEQPSAGDYTPLKECLRDAEAIRDAFLDVPQLNLDPEHVHVLTAKTTDKPTRNAIVAYVTKLANRASEENRVLFYFSGHGERIGDEVYLVPSDAFSNAPAELVPLEDIRAALNASGAKQKIIMLDACFSGPELAKFKAPPAKEMSKAFWKNYLADSKGVALIASSSGSQPSTAKSPGGQLSLFTHFAVMALRGEPKALDGGVLTLESFYAWVHAQVVRASKSYNSQQTPTREMEGAGGIILGDFSAPLALDPSLRLAEFDALETSHTRPVGVNEILTRLTNFMNFPVDKIEWMANQKLENLRDGLVEPAAAIADVLEVPYENVPVTGARIEFPGGSYELTKYEANGKKRGSVTGTLRVESAWLEKNRHRMPRLLRALSMAPTGFALVFSRVREPMESVALLKAQGWAITAAQADRVSAEQRDYEVTITRDRIQFDGFAPSEIMGKDGDDQARALFGTVMAALPAKRE